MEISIAAQARVALEHRYAVLLGAAGVDGRFVYHQVAGLEKLADGFRGTHQRSQIRTLLIGHGRRDGDDVDRAGGNVVRCRREPQAPGDHDLSQLRVRDLAGGIASGAKRVDASKVDIKAYDVSVPSEFHRERKPDVAETDDGECHG